MKKRQEPPNSPSEPISLTVEDSAPVEPLAANTLSDVSVVALIHELQVHQEELRAQNEELKRAQYEMEALAARYRDLYDFAPVGYMTLDDAGRIIEANLASALMLRLNRRELINRSFPALLAPASVNVYTEFRSLRVQAGVQKSYEFGLQRADGTALPVQAEVIAVGAEGGEADQLRVALLDITARKQAEQTVQDHFEVLYRKLGLLTGDLDLERFLRQTLIVLTEQDHAECAAYWFADAAEENISIHSVNDGGRVMTGSQYGHPLASLPLPLQSLPFWIEMRRTRRPLILHDLTTYPQFPMVQGRSDPNRDRTLLLVPLLLGQYVLGLVVLQSLDRRAYRPEEIAFAQAVAQQVTIAVQMGRLGEKARQTAIFQERNRMAQEIHDTLAQGFTVILMQLEVIEDSLSDAPEQAQLHLELAKEMARSSLSSARRSVRAMRPRELEQNGLPGALVEALSRTERETGVRPVLDIQGVSAPLHNDTETNLLRIAQEALYNVQKHADAEQIWIELSYEPNGVRLAVKDDGKGFDTSAMKKSNHFGLQVMQERTESIGGVFQLSSRPGHGTQIMVTVPSRALGEWKV